MRSIPCAHAPHYVQTPPAPYRRHRAIYPPVRNGRFFFCQLPQYRTAFSGSFALRTFERRRAQCRSRPRRTTRTRRLRTTQMRHLHTIRVRCRRLRLRQLMPRTRFRWPRRCPCTSSRSRHTPRGRKRQTSVAQVALLDSPALCSISRSLLSLPTAAPAKGLRCGCGSAASSLSLAQPGHLRRVRPFAWFELSLGAPRLACIPTPTSCASLLSACIPRLHHILKAAMLASTRHERGGP
jgi:hypothetical protein